MPSGSLLGVAHDAAGPLQWSTSLGRLLLQRADVLLPGQGWLAVDASEAKKHLEKRELLYGTLPPDRVAFSSGRDLDVGQKSGPLNYFVDAHVEVGGVKWTRWRKTLTYRVVAP